MLSGFMLRIHIADLQAHPGDQHALIGAISVSAQNVDMGLAGYGVHGDQLHGCWLGPPTTGWFPLPGAFGDTAVGGRDDDLLGAL